MRDRGLVGYLFLVNINELDFYSPALRYLIVLQLQKKRKSRGNGQLVLVYKVLIQFIIYSSFIGNSVSKLKEEPEPEEEEEEEEEEEKKKSLFV